MSNLYNISSTNNGSVSKSSCCQSYRVIYNNLVLFQEEAEFVAFYKNLTSCYLAVKDSFEKDARDIVFQTIVPNMKLIFSAREISELYYLIESAKLETYLHA